MKTTTLAFVLFWSLVSAASAASAASGDWSQWGGPNRDFTVEVEGTIEGWGEHGPKVLWLKTLGPGYSGIVAAGDRLFTMTRRGGDEVILALSAETGEEIWSHAYAASTEGLGFVEKSYGDAPQATPLVTDGRVYGFGFTGILTAVDVATGKAVWAQDLRTAHGAGVPYFGHAASPIRVGDTVVVLAGGAHAFDLKTGELRWKNREFEASYASPILVQSPAGEQIVAAVAGELVGLSPEDGRLLWRHEHTNRQRTFLSSPVVSADGTLFASAYFVGSIGLRFAEAGRPEEVWETAALQVSTSNSMIVDGMVVASHDRNLMAVDAESGKVLWRERGVRPSNMVRVGGRLLLLDERGSLTLAEVRRAGMKRLSQARLLDGRSWTAPSVVGHRLFVRNGKEVAAIDLRASAVGVADTAALLRGEKRSGPVRAPRDFVLAAARVEAAALHADGEALGKAAAALDPWAETPELTPLVHYYRGFAAWQLSLWGPEGERLAQVDRAVESLKRALELDDGLAEAHALLSPLYNSYYRLNPARASVVGLLGDGHLDRALELAPKNPRVTMLHAMDLLQSPVQYGGDPKRGKELMEEAIRRADVEARGAADPGPRWGKAMARTGLASSLLSQGEVEAAKKLLEEALERAPDDAMARWLLNSQTSPEARSPSKR